MRICICVSGQMRKSDDALVSLRDATAGLDVTFVFSVWQRSGRKIDGALNVHQLPRIFEEPALCCLPYRWFGFGNIWKMLPELYMRLSKQDGGDGNGWDIENRIRQYFPNAIIDIERDDLLDLEFSKQHEDKNSVRMLYKVWRANEIKKKIERSSGKFDIVIRSRPDFIINRLDMRFISEKCNKNRILVDGYKINSEFVHDSFACGTSSAIDEYSSLFSEAIFMPNEWHHIHVNLHRHLARLGIAYEKYPYISFFSEDKKVSASEILDALEEDARKSVVSYSHCITQKALISMISLNDGDVEKGLETLFINAPKSNDDTKVLDAYFFVLGHAFLKNKMPRLAGLSVLISMNLRANSPLFEQMASIALLSEAIKSCDSYEFLMSCEGISVYFSHCDLPDWLACLLKDGFNAFDALSIQDLIQEPVRRVTEFAPFFLNILDNAPNNKGVFFYDALLALAENASSANDNLFVRVRLLINQNLGNLDGAIECIRFLEERNQSSIHDEYKMAELLKRARRFDEAYTFQAAALRRDCRHAGANRQMAEICINLNRFDEARSYSEVAFQEVPNELIHCVLLCYICLHTERVERALDLAKSLPFPIPGKFESVMVPDLFDTINGLLSSMTP